MWHGFAGDGADYAIGGSTIEMLMKPYSQKYKVDYSTNATSKLGYTVSKNGGGTWENGSTGMLNKNDSLYVISSTQKADGMWIASPFSTNIGYDNTRVGTVKNNGDVVPSYIRNPLGLRPVICLNSNVKLEKNADGTYKMY